MGLLPSSLGSTLCRCGSSLRRWALASTVGFHPLPFVLSLRRWVPTSAVGLDRSSLGSTSLCRWSRTSVVGSHPSLLGPALRRPPSLGPTLRRWFRASVVGLLPPPFGSTLHRRASRRSLRWVVVAWTPSWVTFSSLGRILVVVRWHRRHGRIVIEW